MPSTRFKIGAAATLAALGLLAAVALASGGRETSQQSAAAPAPEVRTEVVRQTVHRSAPVPAQSGSAPATAPAAATQASPPVRSRADRSGRRSGDDAADHPEDRDDSADHREDRGDDRPEREDDGDAGDDEDDEDDGGHGRGRGRGRGGDDD